MSANNTDFLRFSAYSIKDLITRKLTSDTKFTDQIYEGSNLAILIDIVSYMYQCLLYNLNNAAAESMFADTQIYENINRLVKFIGYNPAGATAGTATFILDVPNGEINALQGTIIPKYSYIDTKITDILGNKVYFSTIETYQITSELYQTFVLYNGIWKRYSTIYTGSGQPYQTLITTLESNSEKHKYIQADKIDIYIDENDGQGPSQWIRSESGVFLNNNINNNQIYNSETNIYTVRLNENKQYEINFGNGTNGKCPPAGSLIYIFYLESNSTYEQLELNQIKQQQMQHNNSMFNINDALYKQIFNIYNDKQNPDVQPTFTNITTATETLAEETVDDIRRNAPEWFKSTYRLITTSDWEYYIKNKYKSYIVDVKCQNNWEYMSTFYRWLYNVGIYSHNNPKYYLIPSKIQRNFRYVDAADQNNIYLWIKTKNSAQIQNETIINDVAKLKVITQQPVCCQPLGVYFAITAEAEDSIKINYFNNSSNKEFDPDTNSYLEITLDDNSLYTANEIKYQVTNIIQNYFSKFTNTLGAKIDYNILLTQIYDIPSISRIRTIYINKDTGISTVRNGICFATWTKDFIDIGDDIEISNSSKTLEDFQYPLLYKSATLADKMVIIKKSISSTNTIKY